LRERSEYGNGKRQTKMTNMASDWIDPRQQLMQLSGCCFARTGISSYSSVGMVTQERTGFWIFKKKKVSIFE
jgi:hypothetical protein